MRQRIFEAGDLWWEKGGISDPTVAEYAGRTYMLYQAVGEDHLSRLGLAVSEDGENFERFEAPILEGDERSTLERFGITAPRLTKIDRDYVLAYAALSVRSTNFNQAPAPASTPWRSRVSLVKTRDFRTFERLGEVLRDLDTHDPVLFPAKIQGTYWLLHRPDKGIYASVSPTIRSWGGGYQLLEPQEGWEAGGLAASCAPLAIDRGWLLFYNALDAKNVSRVGAVLLDRQNPAFVIGRTKEPILEPAEAWEKRGNGLRGVALAGASQRPEGIAYYYGAGGTGIGLGKISVDAVLQSLGLPKS